MGYAALVSNCKSVASILIKNLKIRARLYCTYHGAKNLTNAFFPLLETCSSKSDSFNEMTDPADADSTSPSKQMIRNHDIRRRRGTRQFSNLHLSDIYRLFNVITRADLTAMAQVIKFNICSVVQESGLN